MKFENLNMWLGLLGNLAVVAGIVFLGFEISQNTRVSQVAAHQALVQSYMDINSLVVSDPEVARIYNIVMFDPEPTLSEVDETRYRALMRNYVQQAQLAYSEFQNGFIDELEFYRFIGPTITQVRRSELARVVFRSNTRSTPELYDAVVARASELGYEFEFQSDTN